MEALKELLKDKKTWVAVAATLVGVLGTVWADFGGVATAVCEKVLAQ